MNKLKNHCQLWIPILLGITAFILVTGGKIVWPGNIGWLLQNVDTTTSLYGWEFFRYTPIFQSPLGANYPYGMGMGGSLIFAEPIFLFAFPFKLFSKVLPTPFQYYGLWILLCFIFQAIISWKLIEIITNNGWLKVLGCIFFVLAPAMLWHLHCSPSFFSQWLILAGILFYLSSNFHHYTWPTLLCMSSLIHAYFLLMLLALWIADLIQRKFSNELTVLRIIKYILFTSLILTIVMWQAGYFTVNSGLEAGGLGYLRVNLLSLIDPTDGLGFGSWSHFLRMQPKIFEEIFTGTSYLGLGILILGVLGIIKLIELQFPKHLFFNFKKIAPLIIICIFLMVFALSNRVAFGTHELFQYKFPAICSVFRASGRMILPIYYLIYLGALTLIIKCYKEFTAIILILICLTIQIADSWTIYSDFRSFLSHPVTYNSPLKSPVWVEAAKKYKNLIYIPPEHDPRLLPLMGYAAYNKLNINVGYFARIDYEKIRKNRQQLIEHLENGYLDSKSFYIVQDENLRRMIVNTKMNLYYKVKKADGFFLLLPNWLDDFSEAKRLEWANWTSNSYVLNTIISFKKPNDNFKKYLFRTDGWSLPEGEGTWTDGDNTSLLLTLSGKPHFDLILTVDAYPFISSKHPILEVNVIINNQFIDHLIYNKNAFSTERIKIPKLLIASDNKIKIKFLFKNAISPKQLKLSSDIRKLGLFVSTITLSEEKKF